MYVGIYRIILTITMCVYRFQQIYVAQPTVEATIGILRGLKERYELHHGVSISDAALVAASVLSDRYISERFLCAASNVSTDIYIWYSQYMVFTDGLYITAHPQKELIERASEDQALWPPVLNIYI